MKNELKRCGACKRLGVQPGVTAYKAEIEYGLHKFCIAISELKVNRCTLCAEVYFTRESETQIDTAFRDYLKHRYSIRPAS